MALSRVQDTCRPVDDWPFMIDIGKQQTYTRRAISAELGVVELDENLGILDGTWMEA